MRARNLKPGIYKNEALAELPVAARYLFTGLWCMADRLGRLEDRPKRIKAEVFPYDELDVEPLLDQLATHGFIIRYTVENFQLDAADESTRVNYIQVVKFLKHQRPHQNEKRSEIPAPTSGFRTKVPSALHQGDKHFALNPSSLNPDCAGAAENARARARGTSCRRRRTC